MRTVILGERPPAIEALIELRRVTGADRRDEIWDGDYHMNPAPRKRHSILQSPSTLDHGVDEVVVVDPAARTVTWLVLRDGSYEPTDRSDLLDVDVDDVAGRIDWPPID